MRLTEILREGKFEPREMDPDKVASYIKKNCQPWLSQTNNGKLVVFRGIRKPMPDTFVKSVRKARRPKDSSQTIHKFLNLIIQMSGKTANRSNSIFVTGNEEQAEGYGPAYVIVPIGEFNYTWHTQWDDWNSDYNDGPVSILNHKIFNKLDSTQQKLFTQLDEGQGAAAKIKMTPDVIKPMLNSRIMKGIQGDDGTLQKAIKSEVEIMIHCDKYVAIDAELYQKSKIQGLL